MKFITVSALILQWSVFTQQERIGVAPEVLSAYINRRSNIMTEEQSLYLGGKVYLSSKEREVDAILKSFKQKEVESGFSDPKKYAPGLHFFRAKELIESSNVFKIIKKMPKGAVLHGHNTAMVSSEWIIKNLTYHPSALKCVNLNNVTLLSMKRINGSGCDTYININEERASASNQTHYDKELEASINLYTDNPEAKYLDSTSVWKVFDNMFHTVGGLLSSEGVFEAFHLQLLKEMYEDNVFYVELRTPCSGLIDENGKYFTKTETAQKLYDTVQQFTNNNHEFLGAKIIYSTQRNTEKVTVQERVEIYKELIEKFPDFVVGFDLVGQEDLGKPLNEFIEEFKALPTGTKFFFHAGETNWYGTSVDWNLLDAILMNTTRIGHGFALNKHPILWEIVKKRDIGIEVSPISNQVLHFVSDLRNHPATFYFSENLPVIISNDDPGFWNAKGLSYDMYYAFMCFAPPSAGLATLKQLVWNSIKFATLTNDELRSATGLLASKWETFLDQILAGDY